MVNVLVPFKPIFSVTNFLGISLILSNSFWPITICEKTTTEIKLLPKKWTSGNDERKRDLELPEMEVVELPVSIFPEPRCIYQVRFHSQKGPLVNRQVSIGETLFHIWQCEYGQMRMGQGGGHEEERKRGGGGGGGGGGGRGNANNNNRDSVYCMMVHNCTISNHQKDAATSREGGGNANAAAAAGQSLSKSDPIEIVDEFGCSAWPGILPQIQYAGDLLAKMEVQTFALDFDQPAIFFKCNVRLLLKINGRCRRPKCAQMDANEEREFRRPNSPLNFP